MLHDDDLIPPVRAEQAEMPPEKPQAVRIDAPIRVLVAVPTPLQRSLVHFFLEEAGFCVLPEAAPVEVAAAAIDARPDAVVLHEMLASRDGAGLMRRLRRASPSARIVVLAKQPKEAWCGPARGADAYLDEWIGIAELEGVLHATRRDATAETASGADTPPIGLPVEDGARADLGIGSAKSAREEIASRRRWWQRLQGAAVAAVILLALLRATSVPDPTLPTTDPGRRLAADRLNHAYTLLVYDLSPGTPRDRLVAEARELLAAHAAAMHAGVDVGGLDAVISSRMLGLLSKMPSGTASRILAILEPILPTPPPSPGPSPISTPTPPASATPPPTPSSTSTEIPTSATETPPPTPTETPTSTPTEVPPTTETGSPAPAVGEPSGSVVDQT